MFCTSCESVGSSRRFGRGKNPDGHKRSRRRRLTDHDHRSIGYEELRHLFHDLDKDHDGCLDEEELFELCRILKYPESEVPAFVEEFDVDSSGTLDFDEFSCIFHPEWSHFGPPRRSDDSDDEAPFMDPSFPPDEDWDRVVHLVPEDARLFDNIEPNDITQGQIGDCWLLCALACMAEYPGLVQNCFKEKTIQDSGKYHVKLWDGAIWHEVVIDDHLPGRPGSTWGPCRRKSAIAKAREDNLWVVLIEKAIAKWVGGFEVIGEGGQALCAWRILTGCNDAVVLDQNPQTGNTWTAFQVKFLDSHIIDNYDSHPGGKTIDLWSTLKDWCHQEFLMSAATWKDCADGVTEQDTAHAGEDIRPDNIVKGHAYSVLRAVQVGQFRLVQLRNPWGDDTEWNGAWSDCSREWDDHPEVGETLAHQHKDDGMFWMTVEDFNDVFDTVQCSKVKAPMHKRTQNMDFSFAPHYQRKGMFQGRVFKERQKKCSLM